MSQAREKLNLLTSEIHSSGRVIKLVAVSKTKPVTQIEEFIECGQFVFGENRINDGIEKFTPLKKKHPRIELHHLGPVQSGTAKKLFGNFDFTHGVSSIENLNLLLKLSGKTEYKLGYFLQVNLTGESSKNGFTEEEILEIIPEIQNYQNNHLFFEGLMTMGPTDEDPIRTRFVFRRLSEIRKSLCPDAKLSMGMSGDYKIAIEENTDLIRVGSILFGSR